MYGVHTPPIAVPDLPTKICLNVANQSGRRHKEYTVNVGFIRKESYHPACCISVFSSLASLFFVCLFFCCISFLRIFLAPTKFKTLVFHLIHWFLLFSVTSPPIHNTLGCLKQGTSIKNMNTVSCEYIHFKMSVRSFRVTSGHCGSVADGTILRHKVTAGWESPWYLESLLHCIFPVLIYTARA